MKRIALILAASLVLFGCSDGNRDAVTFAVTEKDVADQVQQKLPQDDAASGTEEDEDDDEDEVSTPSVPVNPGTSGGSSDSSGGNTGSGQQDGGSGDNTGSDTPSTPGTGDGSGSGSGAGGNTGGDDAGSGQTGGQASSEITDNGDGTCTYNIKSVPTAADGKKYINIPTKVDGKVVTKVTFSTHTHYIGIESFKVADDNENFCTEDGVLFSKDKKTLVFCPDGMEGSYTIPKEVETIGEYAFKYCQNLTSINIESGSNLKTIGLWAFGYLKDDAAIDMSNAAGIEKVGDAAFYQKSLTCGVKVTVASDSIASMIPADQNIKITVKGASAP